MSLYVNWSEWLQLLNITFAPIKKYYSANWSFFIKLSLKLNDSYVINQEGFNCFKLFVQSVATEYIQSIHESSPSHDILAWQTFFFM